MAPEASCVFRLSTFVFALRIRQTRRVLPTYRASLYTFIEDGQSRSPFPAQLHVFHQDKVRGEEKRAGANGGVKNGCST